MSSARHFSLDALRGFAVMGILLMNIIGFALPMSAYVNPMAWGHEGQADLIAWGLAFVLVDGKMRGLFSILFGASMVLVIDRADAQGASGTALHFRRMAWLFLLGLLHFWFIWDGDILSLYALCGMAAFLFKDMPPRPLALLGGGLMLANLLIWASILLAAHALRADPAAQAAYLALADALGDPQGVSIADDLKTFQSSYAIIADTRLASHISSPFDLLYGYGAETLGLMLWGMALFKSGALTGQWPRRKLIRLAMAGYGLGVPASLMLAWATARQGFETLSTADIYYAFDLPARMAIMLGHLAALLLLIRLKEGKHSPLLQRVAAAGRMAFSNYILTSLVMTTLFYGYGFGLFGKASRAEIYLAVPPMWLAMLIWSPLWLNHFRYGPLEWLWRSLTKAKCQPLRR
ncbi:MAG: DUF418 domain-containing protein [Chakrabartia sp.]